MSVRKRKVKNVSQRTQDAFIQHHLPYELWMMRESLLAAKKGAPTQVQQNLQVEGFALHARNLIEFLKNGGACGFNPADFTTDKFSVKRTFIRQTLVDMINSQISQLTSNRTENQNEKFDEPHWLETADAIEKEFTRWTDNLNADWAKKWEQRDQMDETTGVMVSISGHFGGACTAPMFLSSSTFDRLDPRLRR
jgi:hypothetical protein